MSEKLTTVSQPEENSGQHDTLKDGLTNYELDSFKAIEDNFSDTAEEPDYTTAENSGNLTAEEYVAALNDSVEAPSEVPVVDPFSQNITAARAQARERSAHRAVEANTETIPTLNKPQQQEITEQENKLERPKDPRELYSLDELRAALAESDMEDEAYAENERRDAATANTTVEQTNNSESAVDYSTRVASSANRIAQFLTSSAEKYEKAGGSKGLAKKALRRIGSALYRKTGLRNEVEGVKRIVKGIDKATDTIGNAIEKPFDKIQDIRITYLERRDAARTRAEQRAKERAKRTQERREKEVMDYVNSFKEDEHTPESNIDLAAEVEKRRGEVRGKHRKANERTQRRRAARKALKEQGIAFFESTSTTAREYWDTSRTKQLGRSVARLGRGTKAYVKGMHEYAKASSAAAKNTANLNVHSMNVTL
tara:strand:- start:7354 stop:8631 length:1278 start_codon:yes stop_codon:yes gene_type:complete